MYLGRPTKSYVLRLGYPKTHQIQPPGGEGGEGGGSQKTFSKAGIAVYYDLNIDRYIFK